MSQMDEELNRIRSEDDYIGNILSLVDEGEIEQIYAYKLLIVCLYGAKKDMERLYLERKKHENY